MQNKHRFLNQAIFVMSFILVAYSQVSLACPGIGNNEPFPTVMRLEIANPQAPSKPHSANPRSEHPNDLRTLMALQGETIDLIYILAEPIPSGCVYGLEVTNYAAHITNGNFRTHTPWKSLLIPQGGFKSEPTTGDNTVKFKIEAAPQFDNDKINTLYASISKGGGYYITEPTPLKFKSLAYKFTNISKEPAKDAAGKVIGIKIKALLNAMPRETETLQSPSFPGLFQGRFYSQYTGGSPVRGEGMTKDQINFEAKYGYMNGVVIKLNNTPMITWVVQNIGTASLVQAYLGFKIDDARKYQRPDITASNMCQSNYSEMAFLFNLCSTATLIKIP